MKTLLFIVASGCLFMIGCKSKSISAPEKTDTATVKSMTVDARTEKVDALKKLAPFGLEDMQKLMPKQVDGAKQSNFNYSMQWGYASATADFNKTKALGTTVQLYDCAGEEGSIYFTSNFYDKLSETKQDSVEYSKIVDLLDGKAIETYNKQVNYSTLTYMVNDRVLVVMQGKKMKPEELKAIAQKLNLKLS